MKPGAGLVYPGNKRVQIERVISEVGRTCIVSLGRDVDTREPYAIKSLLVADGGDDAAEVNREVTAN
eukprot:tig00021428_g21141.t1